MNDSTTPHGFHPLRGLLIAQFCGAFNDHAWKLLVTLLSIHSVAATTGSSGSAFEAASQSETTLAFVVFTLPLACVSLFAGVLADRFSKRTVLVVMKSFEVVLITAGTVVLWMGSVSKLVPLCILGLMGAHSAIVSPAKYGIMPELLPHERLASGNGLLEMWSVIAIIAGTVASGLLLGIVGASTWLAGLPLILIAGIGLAAAWTIPAVPPARTEGGISATLSQGWTALTADSILRLAVLGSITFWFLASMVGQDILVYGKSVLQLSDALSGIPLAILAGGIGVGSLLAARLSASKVEYGLIPLGAAGIAAVLLLLGTMPAVLAATLPLMALLGIACGLLIVPINALIQWRSPADGRGAVIALANTFVFTAVLAGSLGTETLSRSGLSAGGILLAASFATMAATAWALWLLPDACLRLTFVLLTHTFYRLKVIGAHHVPEKGGVLLVPNHVSFVDGFFLMASLDRPIRFIVDTQYFDYPLFRPLMQLSGAIPIATGGGPRVILRALREAGNYLDQGEVVCIFAEGQITRTGMLLPFRRGFERIVKGRQAPIVPVHLDRVWGSIFSFPKGRFVTKIPERIPHPMTVAFGSPLPPGTPSAEVRRAVIELGEASWSYRTADRRPLHRTFVRAMRRRPFRFMFADGTRPHVSRLQTLAGAIALARALRIHWVGQDLVGILLPPSVAGAIVNLSATLAGRTSVNLNYTAGRMGMASAARQANLRSVVTSRLFVERAKLELPEGITPLWLEDLKPSIGPVTRLVSAVLALFGPIRMLESWCGASRPTTMQDIITIIFSSGSTGEPKGVMLSHANVDANVEAVAQVFHIDPEDRLLGILPFFHSFGYMATLWLAVSRGMGVVFHPTPLEPGAIGELVHRYRVTILIATPTFLQLYLRRCTPEQFGSLRAVLTGAEKLSERLAQAFAERFGIQPLEGYGTTECSPVIAVSVPSYRAPGFYQAGARLGHVGHPLPGVATRIVDPDTFETMPTGSQGLLLVRGPNVMRGYLGRADLTAQVMRDGWYVTGDLAILDEDGFLKITDRLTRFSKIGGEMVPHGRVEQALQDAAGEDVQVFAVTGVPDERKGERLAVLHVIAEDRIPEILEKVTASGLPNLFIPRRDQFVKVDTLPILGTGKLDLRAVQRIAIERLQATG